MLACSLFGVSGIFGYPPLVGLLRVGGAAVAVNFIFGGVQLNGGSQVICAHPSIAGVGPVVMQAFYLWLCFV